MKSIFILDWDDTLYPTSSIGVNQSKKLHDLDDALYRLLSKLLRIGQIIIITNASVAWVESSSKRFPHSEKNNKK